MRSKPYHLDLGRLMPGLAALALVAMSSTSCRSNIKGGVSGGDLNRNQYHAPDQGALASDPAPGETPPVPDEQPPEDQILDGGVKVQRTHFQTRSVITLYPVQELAVTGEAFTLSDAATDAVIAQDHWTAAESLNLDGYRMGVAADEHELSLFPLASPMKTRLAYGDLQWRLKLLGEQGAVESSVTVTRRDFDLFALSVNSWRQSLQVIGGFQGGVSFKGGNSLAPDGARLTSGFLNIVNQ